jgi:DNA-directed RNA polymerase specialized sigma24 family protein
VESLEDWIARAKLVATIPRYSAGVYDWESVATLAAWEAYKIWHRGELEYAKSAEAFLATVTIRRLFDERRRWTKYQLKNPPDIFSFELMPGIEEKLPGPDDTHFEWDDTIELIDRLAAGDARKRGILLMLALDYSKAAIAAEYGISPSRISQLLREIRTEEM